MIEDAEAEAEAGTVVKFYFSENKVWLIDKVDPKYIVLVWLVIRIFWLWFSWFAS